MQLTTFPQKEIKILFFSLIQFLYLSKPHGKAKGIFWTLSKSVNENIFVEQFFQCFGQKQICTICQECRTAVYFLKGRTKGLYITGIVYIAQSKHIFVFYLVFNVGKLDSWKCIIILIQYICSFFFFFSHYKNNYNYKKIHASNN